MRYRSTATLLSQILRDPSTLSNFPELSSEDISLVESLFDTQESNSFMINTEIDRLSNGLVSNGQNVTLAMDWGVKLYAPKHSNVIQEPNQIRIKKDKLLINNSITNSCVVLDTSFILKQRVGKYNAVPNLGIGEYKNAVDFNYQARTNTYWVVSKDDNIIHIYNGDTTAYVESLGDGTIGLPSGTPFRLSKPVGVEFGNSQTYIICEDGTAPGANDVGYMAVLNADKTLKEIPLFPGKNNGTGHVYEHEIYAPRSIFVTLSGGKDLIYILNGYDEVGVFDSNTFSLIDLYTIPSELASMNLGLTHITVDEYNLYLTAKNSGKIVAINLKTKELVGIFGMLTDESSLNASHTLGMFNGLSGIAVHQDKIIVTETLNNRVQVLGKSLLSPDSLYIVYKPVVIPQTKRISALTYDLGLNNIEKVVVIDKSNNQEISIEFAKDRKVRHFQIKVVLNPWNFSLEKSVFKLLPIYILME